MSGRRKRTHLLRRYPLSRVERQELFHQVHRFRRGSREEHAKVGPRLLLEGGTVGEFGEALRKGRREVSTSLAELVDHWMDSKSDSRLKRKMLRNRAGRESERTGHSASPGVPNAEKIMFNCSMSLSAAMNGTLSISSAKMQPAAQLSQPVE
jgi:hypothetical protein